MRELMEAGKPMIMEQFGKFEDDKANLDRIAGMSTADFAFFNKQTGITVNKCRGGGEKREAIRKRFEKFVEISADGWPVEDKTEFENWAAEWMQYAGYMSPAGSKLLYKSMIMTAFPVVCLKEDTNKKINDPTPILLTFVSIMSQYCEVDNVNQDMAQAYSSLRVTSLPSVGKEVGRESDAISRIPISQPPSPRASEAQASHQAIRSNNLPSGRRAPRRCRALSCCRARPSPAGRRRPARRRSGRCGRGASAATQSTPAPRTQTSARRQ